MIKCLDRADSGNGPRVGRVVGWSVIYESYIDGYRGGEKSACWRCYGDAEGKKWTDDQAFQQRSSPLVLQDVQQANIRGVEEVIGRVGGFGQEHVGRGDLGVLDRLAEGLPGWVDNRMLVKKESNGARLGMRDLRRPTSPS